LTSVIGLHESTAAPSVEPNRCAKPFLRWAGSKRKQLGRLGSFWSPAHARYVEPFAGSACLFFELAPQTAILGDNNSALIELYRVVRDEPKKVFRRLCRIGRDSDTYYRWRRMKPAQLDRETRAVRFLYLNRNCFNGIFRTNVKGEFNVPMGVRPGEYFSEEDLLLCASLLQRAKLVAGDFAKTLNLVQAGDFVYLDPPFALESRRVFRHYGKRSFQTSDVPRLGEALRTIEVAKADFLVSYADCAEARGLAKEWNSIRHPITRHVGGWSDRRRHAYEWLITNMALPPLD
jgi:DNA adenine methylase